MVGYNPLRFKIREIPDVDYGKEQVFLIEDNRCLRLAFYLNTYDSKNLIFAAGQMNQDGRPGPHFDRRGWATFDTTSDMNCRIEYKNVTLLRQMFIGQLIKLS